MLVPFTYDPTSWEKCGRANAIERYARICHKIIVLPFTVFGLYEGALVAFMHIYSFFFDSIDLSMRGNAIRKDHIAPIESAFSV